MKPLSLGNLRERAARNGEGGAALRRERSRLRALKGQLARVATPPQRNISAANAAAISPAREAFFGQALLGGINVEKFKSLIMGLIKERERASDEGAVAMVSNASSHSDSMPTGLMGGAPHERALLPAWSPFLNPIEKAFAERKAKIKKLFAEWRPEIKDAALAISRERPEQRID